MQKKIVRDVSDHKGVIGGSQVGALLGFSTYKTPYDVWEDYTGKVREVTPEQQEIYDMGHDLEGFIAGQVQKKFNVKLKATKYAYVGVYDWMICHPDRLVVGKVDGKRIAVEIKSSSAYDTGRWGNADSDEVPYDYLMQCYWYYACGVPCDEIWLCRFSNNRLTRYVIRRDDGQIKIVVARAKEMVDKFESGWIPPIENSEKARAVYSRDTSGDIESDQITKGIVDQIRDLKAQIKELEAEEDKLQAEVISYMKDKAALVWEGNVIAKYSKVTSSRLDTKALKAECPDLVGKYTKESSYMKLSI